MHACIVELPRLLKRLLDRFLSNLIEYDPVVPGRIATDGLLKMPCNCLTLSIQVCGEIDRITVLGEAL